MLKSWTPHFPILDSIQFFVRTPHFGWNPHLNYTMYAYFFALSLQLLLLLVICLMLSYYTGGFESYTEDVRLLYVSCALWR